ncbi:MAG TPA: sialidase family protein [Mycobacteriales bacterium]|nr:sialidase family protein [Mycobacteriales bacterium]
MRRSPLLILLCAGALSAVVAPAVARTAPRWVTGPLPVPYAKGTNSAAEPSIAASPDGTLWAAGNFFNPPCGNTVSGCGTDVWRSSNSGRSWVWVGNPFQAIPTSPSEGFGGYDVDVAVAPDRNPQGHYNIYITSLWTGENSLAISRDSGKTWSVLPAATLASATIDRPWLQADGACTAYLGSKEVLSDVTAVGTFNGCGDRPVLTGVVSAFPAGNRVRTGRFTVDTSARSPYQHTLYYPGVAESARRVVVSISTDRGATWTVREVADFTEGVFVPIWPITVATDARGVVYVAWHDATTSYFASSRDGGRTWTKPFALHGPLHTGVYPTVAAMGDGTVAVAWYGTDREGPSDSISEMGAATDPDAARWRLMIARSSDGGRRFGRAEAVTRPIHVGRVCVSGTGCMADGSRALLDNFGLTFDTRGRLAGVFTNALPRVGNDRDGTHSDFIAEVSR